MSVLINFLHTTVSFVFVLAVLVTVHEFGHYFFARLFGVKVTDFSLGFGKKLFSYNAKNGVCWSISTIPAGGYVRMAKEDINYTNESQYFYDDEKESLFYFQPIYKKVLIVLGGPLANFLLAIVIIATIFCFHGHSVFSSEISGVREDSIAEHVGLQVGDVIYKLNSQSVESFSDLRRLLVIYKGQDLTLHYYRDQVPMQVMISGQDMLANKYELGVVARFMNERLGLYDSLKNSTLYIVTIVHDSLVVLSQMLTGARGTEDLGGPIRIAQHSAKSAKDGFISVCWFIAILSINLGFVNLLPIPLLDGGHLFSYLIEMITNKKVAYYYNKYSYMFGVLFLVLLLIFIMYNDLKSIVIG